MTLAVVTGAASGIGRAVCAELATVAGVTVAGLDLSWGSDVPDGLVPMTADVADPASLQLAFDRLDTERHESVRWLVCAAGFTQRTPSADLTPEDWHRMLDVHLSGSLFAAQLAADRMTDGGAIVFFSSVAEFFGWPQRVAYAVAKAGVAALGRTLAVEWAPRNIRVNTIAPGYVETALIQSARDRGELPNDPAGQHAVGRMAAPEEIARPVRFLLSDDASFITGETLVADGGYRIFRGH